MKTFNKILTVIAAAALFATSCDREDPAYKKDEAGGGIPGATGTGYLQLSALNLRIIFDTETDIRPDDTGGATTRPTTRTEPNVDNYLVDIFDAAGTPVFAQSKTYGDLKTELAATPLTLPVGSYRMEVRSEDTVPDVAWENPTYSGSTDFSIIKDKDTTIDELVCTLSNIKVTLACSADLAARLDTDPEVTKATVSIGDIQTAIAVGETRAVYLRAPELENTIEFLLTGKFADGGKVKFSKEIPKVKAGQWRKISLVIAYADKGDAHIDIKVDNFILDDEITVDGSGTWNELILEEEPEFDPTTPAITWPGHNLGEVFQLKASMFNDKGDCTEPMAFDLSSPNGIESLVVDITSDNAAFAESMVSMQIPASVDLCTITPASPAYKWLHTMFRLPVGDQLVGATAKTFDIAGAMPLLYTFNGTHTFAITMTDAKGLTASSMLTIYVDNRATSSAPVVEWIGGDISKPGILTDNMTVRVEIAAPSGGIKSLRVKIDSKALEPMLASAPALLEWFDLCTIDGEEASFLSGTVGFPVGADVQDKTSTFFEIAPTFTGILKTLPQETAGVPNSYKFRLEITDNQGNTTREVLELVQPAN